MSTEKIPPSESSAPVLRVLIVCENASMKFGGESTLPLHYFLRLRRRGIEAWLLAHSRTRGELADLLPGDLDRMIFVSDTWVHRGLLRLSALLPARLAHFSTKFLMRLTTQIIQRRQIKQLISRQRITVIHQPTPVSPREPSCIHGFNAPVIIGPMNGGIGYPAAFRDMQGGVEYAMLTAGRMASRIYNFVIPGKRHATTLLVANQRTLDALPGGHSTHVVELVENGIDVNLWPCKDYQSATDEAPCHFVFLGALVTWKGIEWLLRAFRQASRLTPCTLTIIGGGVEQGRLETLARQLGILAEQERTVGCVSFCGWLPQTDCARRMPSYDALVLASLMECGGAVVLEAMASGLPVIATNWGGPADYLDESCGILVSPLTKESFVQGIADAMVRLARDMPLRRRMGIAGREKVLAQYDWDRKIDQIELLYSEAILRKHD